MASELATINLTLNRSSCLPTNSDHQFVANLPILGGRVVHDCHAEQITIPGLGLVFGDTNDTITICERRTNASGEPVWMAFMVRIVHGNEKLTDLMDRLNLAMDEAMFIPDFNNMSGLQLPPLPPGDNSQHALGNTYLWTFDSHTYHTYLTATNTTNIYPFYVMASPLGSSTPVANSPHSKVINYNVGGIPMHDKPYNIPPGERAPVTSGTPIGTERGGLVTIIALECDHGQSIQVGNVIRLRNSAQNYEAVMTVQDLETVFHQSMYRQRQKVIYIEVATTIAPWFTTNSAGVLDIASFDHTGSRLAMSLGFDQTAYSGISGLFHSGAQFHLNSRRIIGSCKLGVDSNTGNPIATVRTMKAHGLPLIDETGNGYTQRQVYFEEFLISGKGPLLGRGPVLVTPIDDFGFVVDLTRVYSATELATETVHLGEVLKRQTDVISACVHVSQNKIHLNKFKEVVNVTLSLRNSHHRIALGRRWFVHHPSGTMRGPYLCSVDMSDAPSANAIVSTRGDASFCMTQSSEFVDLNNAIAKVIVGKERSHCGTRLAGWGCGIPVPDTVFFNGGGGGSLEAHQTSVHQNSPARRANPARESVLVDVGFFDGNNEPVNLDGAEWSMTLIFLVSESSWMHVK